MSGPSLSVQTARSRPAPFARWFSFPIALGFLLFLMVFVAGGIQKGIVEPDIWWHLRNASQTITTHSLPRFDQYSFTATGSPWIDHEWLSELVYYAAFRASGLRGLAAVYFASSAIIFLGVYYLSCRSGADPKTACIVTSLGILVASVNFGPRMLLFGWLCMVALLIILQRYASDRPGPLWLIPPLFCLWVNLHGSWVLGLIVLGVFIASGLVQGDWGVISAQRFSAGELKRLVMVTVFAVAALFVNPCGYKLVAYPFDLMLRQQANINHIDEWRSVDFHDPRGKVVMVLLLVIFGSALASHRRWRLHEALIGAFALYASLTYWRLQFFSVLIFVPLIAARLQLFPPYDQPKDKPLLNAAIMMAAIAIVLAQFPSEANLRQHIRQNFPEAAVAFMRDHGISDHVFNEYAWGGYLIEHAPEIRTFIDGRADVFVYKGVFDDYVKAIHVDNTFDVLDRYRIQYALLTRQAAIAYLLAHNSCWRDIYHDEIAVVYQRDETTSAACRLPPAGASK